jgi:hypothetical protein
MALGEAQKLRLAFEMAFELWLSCDAWPGRTAGRASRIETAMSERGAFALAGHRSGDTGGRAPVVGPAILAPRRGGSETVAPTRRPGTAGDIDEA